MTIWFYSDPHLDHESLVRGGTDKHPEPARKGFDCAADMAEHFIEEHNKRVKPNDHSYCLGDFTMGKDNIVPYAKRLNGHRRIILGNHDVHPMKLYAEAFGKVCAMREFNGMLFTHIPIAPWSMRWRANIHGHCHTAKPIFYDHVVPGQYSGPVPTAKYINISLEHTQYRPVSLEEISAWLNNWEQHAAAG